jgi:SAM-dependent methyltransferase
MINLKFYKGKDLYSDGETENELLHYCRTHHPPYPKNEIVRNWPFYYHLAPERENILNWYEFAPGSSLLEIGAGCGALTGLFCRKLGQVTAVELSKRRAEIIEARWGKKYNPDIIAGNIEDIVFSEKFDYITLVGVLEYAPSFINNSGERRPAEEMLETVKKLLAPGGTILTAIENQFGLKYFAGAREDHTGLFFSGIEGYPPESKAETFGRKVLEDIFRSSGFSDITFYYPMPDYKLPSVIYSDAFLPDTDAVFSILSPNFDQERMNLFNERKAFKEIIQNNMFPFFANSFLVEAVL